MNSAHEYALNNMDINDSASVVSGDSDTHTHVTRSEFGTVDSRTPTRVAFNTLYEPYREGDVESVARK